MILDNGFLPDVRVYKEAVYLVQKGHDVEILCIDTKNQFIDHPIEMIDGIKVHRFFCRTDKMTNLIEHYSFIKRMKKVIYFYWFLKFFRQVKRYLKKEPYDALHCHDLSISLIASFYLKYHYFVFDMHEFYEKGSSKWKNTLIRFCVHFVQNRADYILYENDINLQNLKSNNKQKMIYIPNYPIVSDYMTYKTNSERFRVSYIGAIRDRNAMFDLARACCMLKQVKVSFYGTGLTEQDANNIHSLNTNAYYHGAFNGAIEASRLFSECDLLYAMYDPTNKNWISCLPVKLFEAIASCTPIIVTKNSAAGDFVEKYKIGYAIPFHDLNELTSVIEKAAKDKSSYHEMVQNIMNIRDKYSWEDVMKHLIHIYES